MHPRQPLAGSAGSIYPLHAARQRPITVTATSLHGPWQASRPVHCCDSCGMVLCLHTCMSRFMIVALCTSLQTQSTGKPSQQWAHSPHPCCYREHIHTRSATESLPGSAHASSSFVHMSAIHSQCMTAPSLHSSRYCASCSHNLQCAVTHLISSCQVDHASCANYTRGHSSSHRSPAKSNGLHLCTVAHTSRASYDS
jgi:hypothetical protein